ncbi:MAG: hypothetical protein WCB36_04490 [Burkholderiales bacterium]
MVTKSNSRKDFIQVAFNIVQQAAGDTEPIPPLTGEKADSCKDGLKVARLRLKSSRLNSVLLLPRKQRKLDGKNKALKSMTSS